MYDAFMNARWSNKVGSEKHVKYAKTRKFDEIRGEIRTKIGGNKKFSEIEGWDMHPYFRK